MQLTANIFVGLIAFIHCYILVLEMFLWKRAVHVFQVPADQRDNALLKTMLQNQGVYNGFLAVGLVWGLLHSNPAMAFQIKLFFLACVAVAGIVGAVTAQVRILFIQTIPASIAIILLLILHYQ